MARFSSCTKYIFKQIGIFVLYIFLNLMKKQKNFMGLGASKSGVGCSSKVGGGHHGGPCVEGQITDFIE